MRRLIILLALSLFLPPGASGQEDGEPVVLGHRYAVRSSILGKDRPVTIGLPAGYDPAEPYPVIYVLDAGDQFLQAYSSMRFLAGNERMPSAIVVGVHNTGDDRSANLRPPSLGGEGDRFASFLRDELKPWVAERYLTRPYDLLVGHSLGGLFAAYLLNMDPGFFDAYVVISPSLHARTGYADEMRDLFDRHPDARGSWYMTMGNEGGAQLADAWQLAGTFEQHAPSGFRWKWKHMPEETHGTVPARSVYDGFEWIFEGFNPVHLWDDLATNGAEAMSRVSAHFDKLSNQMGYEVDPPVAHIAQIGTRLGVLEGRVEDEVEITRTVVEWAPEHPEVQFRHGSALGRACRLEEARVHHDLALDLARQTYGEDAPLTLAMVRVVENFRARVENGEQCEGPTPSPGERPGPHVPTRWS